jgi:hypothetical protein
MSISINGQEMNVEKALDQTVRELQQHLNQLQCIFREIAMSSEQSTGGDDFEDLKMSCHQVDGMQDHILSMNNLFEDLMDMSDQLIYLPETKEEKAYVKDYKAKRKVIIDDKKKKWAEERKQYKKDLKEKQKKEKSEMKSIEEED